MSLKSLTKFDRVANAVLREQQSVASQRLLPMAGINLTNAVLTTIALMVLEHSFTMVVLLWTLLQIGFSAMWFHEAHKRRGTRVPRFVSGRYMRRATVMAALASSSWALLPLLVYPFAEYTGFFLISVQVAMVSGFAALMMPVPSMVRAYAVPNAISAFLTVYVVDPIAGLLIGALLCVYVAAVEMGGRIALASLRERLRAAEQEAASHLQLTNAIEGLQDAFGVYDENGKLLRANKVYMTWFPKSVPLDDILESDVLTRSGRTYSVKSNLTADGEIVVVLRDMTDENERQRAIEEAKRLADEVAASREEFLRNMSSELIAPLRKISAGAAVMSSRSKIELDQDFVRAQADSIHDLAVNLTQVADTVLSYAQLQSGRFLSNQVPTDLKSLLSEVANEQLALAASGRRKDVRIKVHPRCTTVIVDHLSLKRAIGHVLSNALKFSHAGTLVEITARLDADGAPVICVTDHGRGIPTHELNQVFEPFFRGMGDRQGGGMGLTIARALVEANDGRLTLESREGEGTSAIITLPENARLDQVGPDSSEMVA